MTLMRTLHPAPCQRHRCSGCAPKSQVIAGSQPATAARGADTRRSTRRSLEAVVFRPCGSCVGVSLRPSMPRDRVRPLGNGRWELKAAIDAECQRGLEELKGLLSHTDPSMTYGELIARLVREGLDRHDPRRRGAGRRSSAPETKEEQAGGGAPQRKAESTDDAAPVPAPEAGAESAAHATRQAESSAKHVGTRAPAPKLEPDAVATPASAPETGTQPAANGAPEAESDTQAAARSSAAETQPRAPGAPVPAPQSKRQPTGPATSAPETRTIPTASKREVWQRDAGRCSYVDPESGRRCTARYLLQVEHIQPYALGGTADPDNLRLLCAAHHRHRHAEFVLQRPPPRRIYRGSGPSSEPTTR